MWLRVNYISANFSGLAYFTVIEFLPRQYALGLLYTNRFSVEIIPVDCFEVTNTSPPSAIIDKQAKEYMEDPLFEIELKRIKR